MARSFINKQKAKIKWEVVATTEQELESSFRRLAKHLAKSTNQEGAFRKLESIADINNRREEVIAFVSEILKGISNWTLLFDNVQNLEVVKKYIPLDHNLWGNGIVIITTKNSKLGENYPFSTNYNLQISEISPEEQFELFMKINKNYVGEIDKKKLKVFLDDIPRLPLDSAITAYYIKNTKIGFNEYLKYLQEYSDDFQKVQQKIAINSTNYDKTRFGIISSDFREIMKDWMPVIIGGGLIGSGICLFANNFKMGIAGLAGTGFLYAAKAFVGTGEGVLISSMAQFVLS